MHPAPLPQELRGVPFRVAESGLSAKRLRAQDLNRSIRGIRLSIVGPVDLRTQCSMMALRLRDDAVFSHTTAALLLGAPLPLGHARSAPLHVSVARPLPPPHARGIAGHRLDFEDGDTVESRGLRHTSALRTWIDLASVLGLDDLVAVGDYFIHWQQPMMSVDRLRERLERMAGKRGVRLAREAVELLSDRPESRPESLLRLILLRSGLPEPRINHTLVDTETGKNVRPDFIFDRERLILEYQGDYHRTKKQWRKDMTRRSNLELQGWRVMELNADDLDDPIELQGRIRAILALRRSPS